MMAMDESGILCRPWQFTPAPFALKRFPTINKREAKDTAGHWWELRISFFLYLMCEQTRDAYDRMIYDRSD